MRTLEQQKAIDDFRDLFPGATEDKTDKEIEDLLINLSKAIVKFALEEVLKIPRNSDQ